ncbi:nuclear transport factor 2 family protein [Sphingomonas sp.]|uniref:nuclear transport factor 2 family protein n=1 Tax=Sphingomonas sp. TaxID=28214 RepID=UPI003CC56FF4
MADGAVAVVQRLYDCFAQGDVPGALATMAPDIVWNEANNHPYADGNPYIGPEAVLHGVFARCVGEWDAFAATPDELLDAGDVAIGLGHYTGVNKASGKPMRTQFAHVCRVRDGRIVAFQQYADTLHMTQAMDMSA